MRILTFNEAIEDANQRTNERTVILGNGFSIDYDASVFTYESLADEAELEGLSVDKADLFRALGTSNFELVIDRLKAAAALRRLYDGNARAAALLDGDAIVVRNGLADVLASRHPENSNELTADEVVHARTFLSNFRTIFTLSYDLLLYWVINSREYGGDFVPSKDGFEYPTAQDRSRLVWKSKPTQGRQRIFFLHGALHLFKRERRTEKISYSRSGPLVRTLRTRLQAGEYPLVVTEGRRDEKEERIESSKYLRFAHRRLAELEGAVFIHGASLSTNDDHIWDVLESSTCNVVALYVGIRGTQTSAGARRVIARAKEIARAREDNGGASLRLKFYRATTAHVWRE